MLEWLIVLLHVYIQKEGVQAVNHLSGARAQHGVWARILEKFRFEHLSVNSAKRTLIGVQCNNWPGSFNQKSRCFEVLETKRKCHGSFISSYDQQQMINDT